MNIHEYQAKQLFADYGIPVPEGKIAFSAQEAVEQAQSLGGTSWMIKAQIHAGGRGKAGGVKKAQSLEEVATFTAALIGTSLITPQTGTTGQQVNCVLVEKTVGIQSELYVSFLVDRSHERIAILVSAAGGMSIEEVAAKTPEKLLRIIIDPIVGIQAYQCRQIAFSLNLNPAQRKQMTALLFSLYQLFKDKDLSLVEINPLIVTDTGDLLALDAKVTLDDNALYRHSESLILRDPSQEDEKECRARDFDLSYVALQGDIACMVNGAGLAMATMDLIKIRGGEPANFLDVGGGTNTGKVTEAFKIIASDVQVKAILVNIFGGIVKCDMIAEGVIEAMRQTAVKLPVVVRLEGTNAAEGAKLLRNSSLPVTAANDLESAVSAVVALAKGQVQ